MGPAREVGVASEVGVGWTITHVFERTGTVPKEVDVEVTVHLASPRTWTERLPTSPGGDHTWTIDWRVTLHDPRTPGDSADTPLPVDVTFRVLGLTSGSERLKVGASKIRLTDDPRLTRIMLHEFAREDGKGGYEFEPARCENVIADLTPEQKRLLTEYEPPGGKPRLVCFITLYGPSRRKLLGADFCSHPYGSWGNRVFTNASFSAFRCAGKGKDVLLACHTDNMLVSPLNGSTLNLIKNLRQLPPKTELPAGVSKLEKGGLDRRCPAPRRYLLTTGVPDGGNVDLPWSRVFTPDGTDVMPSNTIHGMINSHGCWMLFRNYNWPQAKFAEFERAFTVWRKEGTYEALKGELDKIVPGYSPHKFAFIDRNYAYMWFFHELLGLRYWGESETWEPNDYEVHGFNVHPKIPASLNYKPPLYPDETLVDRLGYPTPEGKKPEEYADSLWGTNVFGDQPSRGFFRKRLGMTPAQVLAETSWADLYFYAEPDEDFPPK